MEPEQTRGLIAPELLERLRREAEETIQRYEVPRSSVYMSYRCECGTWIRFEGNVFKPEERITCLGCGRVYIFKSKLGRSIDGEGR